ncbi:uncharacterized protein LOC108197560 [Daucus carota subsp. sativus]|uniref:uncharacterized protein LOC108197560 n=1 Tax=Daucus carota subsp. sativus TaxID=79200 RepID=UPI0007F0354A|nr:PREDICTED: uncharacterized protein LOC108197560 [Daucus carota subsp. sativus]
MGVVFITKIEKAKQWWRLRLSFKNATFFVCFLNILTALLLLQPFLFASSPRKSPSHPSIAEQINYIKESEEIRRAMEPVELIKRVREIEREVYVETEPIQQKDTKQAVAVNLISRLNDFHVNSDAASMKALEEWRMRKMERAKQRGLGKNATITVQ